MIFTLEEEAKVVEIDPVMIKGVLPVPLAPAKRAINSITYSKGEINKFVKLNQRKNGLPALDEEEVKKPKAKRVKVEKDAVLPDAADQIMMVDGIGHPEAEANGPGKKRAKKAAAKKPKKEPKEEDLPREDVPIP